MHTTLAYAPYGYHAANGVALGFNGERVDRASGHYHLGNGYRAYNPVLMRFNSPDSMSPFAQGGWHAYLYCKGDPVNHQDPSGHAFAKLIASVVKTRLWRPRQMVASAEVVADSLFTKRIGWHGTSGRDVPSLTTKLSTAHSLPHRQAQGKAVYVAPTIKHARQYADLHEDGVVLEVLVRSDVSLVPGIGYSKDVFDVVALKEPALEVVRMRETAPPGTSAANLPRTGVFARRAATQA